MVQAHFFFFNREVSEGDNILGIQAGIWESFPLPAAAGSFMPYLEGFLFCFFLNPLIGLHCPLLVILLMAGVA